MGNSLKSNYANVETLPEQENVEPLVKDNVGSTKHDVEREWVPGEKCEELSPVSIEAQSEQSEEASGDTQEDLEPVREEPKYIEIEDDSEIFQAVESNATLKKSRVSFLKGLHGPPITFKLSLHSTETKKVEEKELTVDKGILSQSVLKLKLCIEHHHRIPACTQTITFESTTLEDEHLLSYYHLRDEDVLNVHFERTGDLIEVMEVVDKMKRTYVLLKPLEQELKKGALKESSKQSINWNVCSEDVENLPDAYFANAAEQAEVNRIFFVDCGGVRMLHKLHEELLGYQWSHLPLRLQSLELSILRTFWNLTADFAVRMSVLRNARAVQNIIKSFLRIRIDEKSRQIKPPISVYRENSGYDWWKWKNSAVNLPFKSMGALCNLAEIPGCHMKIASNKAVLKQLVAVVNCKDYSQIAGMISIGGMLCLSHSSNTHRNLAAPSIVAGIEQTCKRITEENPYSKLFQYFAVILYAIILTTSPQLVSTNTRLTILEMNKTFYSDADFQDIRQEEKRNGFKWSTLVPYLKLAYHAYSHPTTDLAFGEQKHTEEMSELNRYCIKSGIFSLSNMLQCPETRHIFIQEGLMDYLVCMPWLYPEDWPERHEALSLVAFMGRYVQLQPPSLIHITKSKLAGMYFGLEKVLSTDSVHQLMTEAYA